MDGIYLEHKQYFDRLGQEEIQIQTHMSTLDQNSELYSQCQTHLAQLKAFETKARTLSQL